MKFTLCQSYSTTSGFPAENKASINAFPIITNNRERGGKQLPMCHQRATAGLVMSSLRANHLCQIKSPVKGIFRFVVLCCSVFKTFGFP